VGCSNPCPCGLGPPGCTCSDVARARYRRRLSAPLLDRFDLRVAVQPPEPGDGVVETSDDVRARVAAAVERQRQRFRGTSWRRNAQIPAGALDRMAPLRDDALDAWRAQADVRTMTGRGAARVRRVARTLADLDDSPNVVASHVLWAAMLRDDIP